MKYEDEDEDDDRGGIHLGKQVVSTGVRLSAARPMAPLGLGAFTILILRFGYFVFCYELMSYDTLVLHLILEHVAL